MSSWLEKCSMNTCQIWHELGHVWRSWSIFCCHLGGNPNWKRLIVAPLNTPTLTLHVYKSIFLCLVAELPLSCRRMLPHGLDCLESVPVKLCERRWPGLWLSPGSLTSRGGTGPQKPAAVSRTAARSTAMYRLIQQSPAEIDGKCESKSHLNTAFMWKLLVNLCYSCRGTVFWIQVEDWSVESLIPSSLVSTLRWSECHR